MVDPLGNETDIWVQGLYETERLIYQGSNTGTLLATLDTCYNGAVVPCKTTAITPPVSNRTAQTTVLGLSPSKIYTTFNTYGLPTETDEYDYGPTLARKTMVTYVSPGNNIYDRPASIAICKPGGTESACGGSGTLVGNRSYQYDSAGNMLSASSSGQNMGTLARSYTYGSFGLVNTITDFNNAQTTYHYGTCNNTMHFQLASACRSAFRPR